MKMIFHRRIPLTQYGIQASFVIFVSRLVSQQLGLSLLRAHERELFINQDV